MENDSQAPLCDTYEDFDIHSLESEVKAQRQIDEMSGDVDDTHADDANIPDVMPLPDALNLVDASHADGFQFAKGVAEQMLAQYSAKAEDVKATQDSRTLHANMSLALKKLLVEWGARIAEAEERVQQCSPDERRRTGVNVAEILEPKEPIICGPSSLDEAPKSYPGPSAGVQSNTKKAQEWLKSNAPRD
jgi:hypothetical protein